MFVGYSILWEAWMRNGENGVDGGNCGIGNGGGRGPSGTPLNGWRCLAILALVGLLLGGCASGPTPKEKLASAYKELESPTPNYAEMVEASDAYLKENPTGPAAADAFYLHGRAL